MAKLNKQEVNAVANKLHRELSKVAENFKKQAIENYVPSEVFSKVKDLLEKRDYLSCENTRIYKELEATRKAINQVCDFFVYNDDTMEDTLKRIIEKECKLPEVPKIEEIKDEITIAAIDENFDTEAFIESQIFKFTND